MKYVLAFSSTHRVLKAEGVLKEKDAPFRLDPAPSALAAHCDLIITVDEEALAYALEILGGADVRPVAVYRKEEKGYVKV
ncbi:MAG: DUF3343 domain-containing protein [Deltaproteobacteria bacterium]|nr:DUF3343 domain-containing protein [Deltaproteobacteria bacterium]